MYLLEALWCTATITHRLKSLIEKERAIDRDKVEEEERTHTAVKDWNESHYIETIRVTRPHDLLSSHQRTNGKGIHIPVGDISMTEG